MMIIIDHFLTIITNEENDLKHCSDKLSRRSEGRGSPYVLLNLTPYNVFLAKHSKLSLGTVITANQLESSIQ